MIEQVPNERECGDCGMCCKLMGVKSIAKPPHSWCGHYRQGQGCAVYHDRPGECRGFNCFWLSNLALDDRWRPDRARFVLHQEEAGRRLSVEVDPSRPDAWRKAPYLAALQDWAARGAARGMEVMVFVGRRGYRLDGAAIVDLGEVRRMEEA